jgi:hypothetical protein
MGWIRNIDKLNKADTKSYCAEYEIASEVYIPGLLDYMKEKILCGPMTFNKDHRGLYKYALKVRYAQFEGKFDYKRASAKGYLFKEGIPGELLALFCLYFQARFYLLAAFSGELDPKGLKIKLEYDPIHKPCFPTFDPTIYPDGKRNFAKGLPDFLDQMAKIPEKYHQQLILAFYHYSMALKEFGVNEEMVFIRLVSAIEALSKWVELKKDDDLFWGRDFQDIIKSKQLSNEEISEVKNLFDVRKAKLKFERFVEQYSKGFFKGGKYKAPHTRIKKGDLSKTLSAIYDSRSDYLHRGETMYLSQPMRGGEKWDTDPTFGMIIDNRRFPAKKKLPYGSFFQRLVRHCLLEFIKEISR